MPRGAHGMNDVYLNVLQRQHIEKKQVLETKTQYQKLQSWEVDAAGEIGRR